MQIEESMHLLLPSIDRLVQSMKKWHKKNVHLFRHSFIMGHRFYHSFTHSLIKERMKKED